MNNFRPALIFKKTRKVSFLFDSDTRERCQNLCESFRGTYQPKVFCSVVPENTKVGDIIHL